MIRVYSAVVSQGGFSTEDNTIVYYQEVFNPPRRVNLGAFLRELLRAWDITAPSSGSVLLDIDHSVASGRAYCMFDTDSESWYIEIVFSPDFEELRRCRPSYPPLRVSRVFVDDTPIVEFRSPVEARIDEVIKDLARRKLLPVPFGDIAVKLSHEEEEDERYLSITFFGRDEEKREVGLAIACSFSEVLLSLDAVLLPQVYYDEWGFK